MSLFQKMKKSIKIYRGLGRNPSLYLPEKKNKQKILVVENGKQLTQSTKEVKKNLVIIMDRVLCECVLKISLEQTVIVKFGTSLETLFYQEKAEKNYSSETGEQFRKQKK